MGESPHPGNYAGQRQWIERSARLLGLSDAVSLPESEAIAEELAIAGLDHREFRQQFLSATRLVQRGQAIASVLTTLPVDDDVFARLLAAGARSGCWCRAWLFHPRLNRRISPLSRVGRAIRCPPP